MAHAARPRRRGLPPGLLRPVVALVLGVSLTACSGIPGVFVIEKPGASATGAGGGEKFDAAAYADRIWASKVVPTARKNAVDATTLLPALRKDQKAAGARYGERAGTGSPYSFLIKGSGTVTGVSNTSGAGSMQLDVKGAGKTDVNVAIGPAIVGTAIRDAVGFIKFSGFTNQIDYANVATALNTTVKKTVLKGLDRDSIKGKKVTFTGAFQLLSPSSVMITPITLEVGS